MPHSRRKSASPVKKTQRRLFLGIRGISGRELPTPPDCSICLGEIHRPVKLECGHFFCLTCISQSSVDRRTCPYCRRPFIMDNVQIPAPLNLMEFRSYLDPLQNLSLNRTTNIFNREDNIFSHQVYYMSNLQVVQLDNVEDYMYSTISYHPKRWFRTAYQCWKCYRFTDYRGHSYGCLGCLRKERTIPRSQLAVHLDPSSEIIYGNCTSMIEHLVKIHGANVEDPVEQAEVASRYSFVENIIYNEMSPDWTAEIVFST